MVLNILNIKNMKEPGILQKKKINTMTEHQFLCEAYQGITKVKPEI